MNRRDMLRVLLGSAAAATMDFERLLWVPKPIVIVPSMGRVGLDVAAGADSSSIWLLAIGEDRIFGIYPARGKKKR